MIARLPLGAFLLVVAGLDLGTRRPDLPLASAGLIVGLALAVTVALDRLWHGGHRSPGLP